MRLQINLSTDFLLCQTMKQYLVLPYKQEMENWLMKLTPWKNVASAILSRREGRAQGSGLLILSLRYQLPVWTLVLVLAAARLVQLPADNLGKQQWLRPCIHMADPEVETCSALVTGSHLGSKPVAGSAISWFFSLCSVTLSSKIIIIVIHILKGEKSLLRSHYCHNYSDFSPECSACRAWLQSRASGTCTLLFFKNRIMNSDY